ncbi:DUF7666 domain-containing protein [Intestinimonas butyriciproducens]|uniref:DUF7666 domain-containing protein n=1 Tax=Intestinimonas butyriciproducens TaxID=1297617 RepID=UPI000950FAD5|nr:hypothetical protein [Intestinimonas butyriciproducens]OLR66891.1 hypothetical protein BIV19_04395 [Intestinimonas butyriciproducens]
MNYKGMDANMQCRGFQYEVGKEYETDEAVACETGFPACEYPLDVINYYAPAESRYAVVEQSGKISKSGEDTNVASTKIKIVAEIGIAGLVKAAIEYTKTRAKEEPGGHATGNRGAASATGNRGAASATGYQGAASATGNRGAASATGYQGAASATGDQGAASATGNQGAASATGNQGAASATGNQGAASATGDQGAASATGNQGAASATGYRGAASATGYQGAASATGDQGAASATGDQGAASATGNQGAASATGKAGVALATGFGCKAKGAIGCAICVVERGNWDGETYPIINIKAAIVDGDIIKADTYYMLINGAFVEA